MQKKIAIRLFFYFFIFSVVLHSKATKKTKLFLFNLAKKKPYKKHTHIMSAVAAAAPKFKKTVKKNDGSQYVALVDSKSPKEFESVVELKGILWYHNRYHDMTPELQEHANAVTEKRRNATKRSEHESNAMRHVLAKCVESFEDETAHDLVPIVRMRGEHFRMWACVTEDQLLRMVTMGDNNLYEMISYLPCKVYFDIDKKQRMGPEYLEEVKGRIVEMFPGAIMAVSGSVTDERTSYHIVLSNYIVQEDEDMTMLKTIVKRLNKFDDAFDDAVYNRNRQFKCINQSKHEKSVQAIIENDNPKAHLITCFIFEDNIEVLPFPKEDDLPESVRVAFELKRAYEPMEYDCIPEREDIVSLRELPPPQAEDDEFNPYMAPIEVILSLLPLDNSGNFKHAYTHMVARFVYHESPLMEESSRFFQFLHWLKQKHGSLLMSPENVKHKKWAKHWAYLKEFPVVDRDMIVKKILHRYHPEIGTNKYLFNLKRMFHLPLDKIREVDALTKEECLDNVEKVSVLKFGMGMGKTQSTIQYLKTQQDFILLMPNQALGHNIRHRMQQEGIDVAHYNADYKPSEKKNGGMNVGPKRKKQKTDSGVAIVEPDVEEEVPLNGDHRLIVCLNSLFYLDAPGKKFDVLVIDEVETFIDKFLGEFVSGGNIKKKQIIWRVFTRLFKMAKKVILLDAFVTMKTDSGNGML